MQRSGTNGSSASRRSDDPAEAGSGFDAQLCQEHLAQLGRVHPRAAQERRQHAVRVVEQRQHEVRCARGAVAVAIGELRGGRDHTLPTLGHARIGGRRGARHCLARGRRGGSGFARARLEDRAEAVEHTLGVHFEGRERLGQRPVGFLHQRREQMVGSEPRVRHLLRSADGELERARSALVKTHVDGEKAHFSRRKPLLERATDRRDVGADTLQHLRGDRRRLTLAVGRQEPEGEVGGADLVHPLALGDESGAVESGPQLGLKSVLHDGEGVGGAIGGDILTRGGAGARYSAPTMRMRCKEALYLRPWAFGDEPNLVRHANHRQVWRNLRDRFPHPYTDTDARVWVAIVGEMDPLTQFAIEYRGEAVGGIGFDRGHDVYARSAEVGFWLGPTLWGKGIVSAALQTLTEHAFATTDLVRLEAGVVAWNPASARVLEKVGYTLEGRLVHSVFKDGEFADRLIYARLRDTTTPVT